MGDKVHIGDGVYVSHDAFHVWLETPREGGFHRIALEPAVFREMLRAVRSIEQEHENPGYWTGETGHPA